LLHGERRGKRRELTLCCPIADRQKRRVAASICASAREVARSLEVTEASLPRGHDAVDRVLRAHFVAT
jgi:hypothetical protein